MDLADFMASYSYTAPWVMATEPNVCCVRRLDGIERRLCRSNNIRMKYEMYLLVRTVNAACQELEYRRSSNP